MDYDISHLLDQWEYQPGQVVVRRFKGKDGRDRIQLRVDLGLLQMFAEGRPDGRRPFGQPSLFEHHQARLYKYVAAHNGSDEGFRLKPEEVAKLQLEAVQYHHRYICLLQLEDYAAVVRDAERNLAVFEFVNKHADSEDMAWSLQQFQPQLLMILTRARAAQALQTQDYTLAIGDVSGRSQDHPGDGPAPRPLPRNGSKGDLYSFDRTQPGPLHHGSSRLRMLRRFGSH